MINIDDEQQQPLRASFVRLKFGDRDEERRALAQEEEDARSQPYRYRVRRFVTVTLPDGRRLIGLSQIEPADAGGLIELQRLIRSGAVSEITQADAAARASRSPERCRYQVGPKAIVGAARILSPGEYVCETDFAGQEHASAQPFQPARLDERGNVLPAIDAIPERQGLSGADVLRRWFERAVSSIRSPKPDRQARATSGSSGATRRGSRV